MPLTAEQKKLVEDNYRLIYKFAGVNKLDITDGNIYDALGELIGVSAQRVNEIVKGIRKKISVYSF